MPEVYKTSVIANTSPPLMCWVFMAYVNLLDLDFAFKFCGNDNFLLGTWMFFSFLWIQVKLW